MECVHECAKLPMVIFTMLSGNQKLIIRLFACTLKDARARAVDSACASKSLRAVICGMSASQCHNLEEKLKENARHFHVLAFIAKGKLKKMPGVSVILLSASQGKL